MPANTHKITGLLIALTVFILDQFSKWFVIDRLRLPERMDAIELLPIFRLIWVENRGISLGKLVASTDGERWMLVVLTTVIALGCIVWLWREERRGDALALGLIIGGAVGNILDRVRFGYVADFLNLHFGDWSPFLVFNVADMGVSIGVALLVLRALFARDPAASETSS